MDIKNRSDYQLYRVGKWIWIPILILMIWFSYFGYSEYFENKYICTFKSITGLMCPGCGGTRAIVFLMHGDILKSIIYHPCVILFVALYIHFMVLFFFRLHISENIENKKIKADYYVYIFIAVLIIQWIFKIVLALL